MTCTGDHPHRARRVRAGHRPGAGDRRRAAPRGVAVHLDGARLFNAQVATGTGARDWAACADTVTFCFLEGARRAGGIDGRRPGGRRRAGQGLAQASRRGDAPGGPASQPRRRALTEGPLRLAGTTRSHTSWPPAERLLLGLRRPRPRCTPTSSTSTSSVLGVPSANPGPRARPGPADEVPPIDTILRLRPTGTSARRDAGTGWSNCLRSHRRGVPRPY
ncbi:hypothetical protein HBB16_20185 [Pseudonocardia sp. MCCB 268]|nr:hypothetical protein [Pseudonocardia cytotoxica]